MASTTPNTGKRRLSAVGTSPPSSPTRPSETLNIDLTDAMMKMVKATAESQDPMVKHIVQAVTEIHGALQMAQRVTNANAAHI